MAGHAEDDPSRPHWRIPAPSSRSSPPLPQLQLPALVWPHQSLTAPSEPHGEPVTDIEDIRPASIYSYLKIKKMNLQSHQVSICMTSIMGSNKENIKMCCSASVKTQMKTPKIFTVETIRYIFAAESSKFWQRRSHVLHSKTVVFAYNGICHHRRRIL